MTQQQRPVSVRSTAVPPHMVQNAGMNKGDKGIASQVGAAATTAASAASGYAQQGGRIAARAARRGSAAMERGVRHMPKSSVGMAVLVGAALGFVAGHFFGHVCFAERTDDETHTRHHRFGHHYGDHDHGHHDHGHHEHHEYHA